MKRTLLSRALLLAALGTATGACALDIRSYDIRADVAADGAAAAQATLQLAAVQPGRVRVPLGFPAVETVALAKAPAGVTVAARPGKDQSVVEIEFPADAGPEATVVVEFKAPKFLYTPKPEEGQKATFPDGSRLLRHGLVNTQPAPIGRYRVTVLLPDGSIVHNIREQSPKPKRKEFVPRVELDAYNGRQGALLQISGLAQGDRTAMELEVVNSGHSLAWLLVMVPLALGYCWAFRDTVAGKPA